MRPGGTEQRQVRWLAAAVAGALALATAVPTSAAWAMGGPVAAAAPAPPSTAAVAPSGPGAGPTTTAATESLAAERARAAHIAAALQSQGRQRDVLAERLDSAKIHADQVAVQVLQAQARVAAADAQMASARAVLRYQAVQAYVLGGQIAFLAYSGGKGAEDMVRREAYASTVAGAKQDALRTLKNLRRQLGDARTSLAAEQRAANAALAAVGADGLAAARVAAAEQATLSQVQGDMAVLVADQQTRLANQQSARLQAAPAARRDVAPSAAPAIAAVVASPAPVAAPAPPTSKHPAPPPVTVPPTTAPPAPSPTVGPPPPTTPTTRPAPPPPPPPPPVNQPAPGWQIALATARAQLGKPYQWGAAGPNSFDCSGLTMVAWAAAGFSMPHLAQAQYDMTRRIAIADLLPGDLVFYGTPNNVYHVGIYVGGGTMIAAPQTGEFVSYTTIYFSGLFAGGRV